MSEQIWKLQCLAVLLQGNHLSPSRQEFFWSIIFHHQGNNNVVQFQVFDLLTVAALIDGQVLCVHGGLSPDIRTLDQVDSHSPAKTKSLQCFHVGLPLDRFGVKFWVNS